MNLPPNPRLQGRDVQQKLARDTAAWLKRNDPRHRLDRLRAKQKRIRDERQARENPALIRERRKALGL